MGSLFSSKSETTTSGDPIKQQAFQQALPFWQQGLAGASNLFNQTNANPAYSGQRVADLNPFQISGANYLGNFSRGFTPRAVNATANMGFSNLAAGNNYGSNAQSIFSRASGDPTQQIINQAGQYSNNPYLNGQIDAANRDVARSLAEVQLPGIDRAATGGGGLNSTRAGVQAAIASRGAADRMADTASNMRSQFFGKGLDMAQNQYNQNIQNMLNSNQGLYNAANLGMNALTGAQGMASTGAGQQMSAGELFQNQAQNQLNANKSQFDESLQNRLAVLNALLGSTSYGQGWSGGPQTQTTTGTPSFMQSLGGTLLGAGSMMSGLGSLGWTPFASPASTAGQGYFGGLKIR